MVASGYGGHPSVVRVLLQTGATVNTTSQVRVCCKLLECMCSAHTHPSLFLQFPVNFMLIEPITIVGAVWYHGVYALPLSLTMPDVIQPLPLLSFLLPSLPPSSSPPSPPSPLISPLSLSALPSYPSHPPSLPSPLSSSPSLLLFPLPFHPSLPLTPISSLPYPLPLLPSPHLLFSFSPPFPPLTLPLTSPTPTHPPTHPHSHMTIHSVGMDCPPLCSTRRTRRHC